MARAGIYKITNLINNKVYIGQSVNLDRRLREYEVAFTSSKSQCCNKYLLKSFKKYGRDNFNIEVLVEFSFFDFKNSKDCEFLNFSEQYFIKKYKSLDRTLGYNLVDGTTCNYTTKKNPHSYLLKNLKTEEVVRTDSLTRFCIENNLDQRRMFSISKNRPECRSHKDWTVLEVDGKVLDQSNRLYSKEHSERLRSRLKGVKKSKLHIYNNAIAQANKYLLTSANHPSFCSIGLGSDYLISLGLHSAALHRVAKGQTVSNKHKGFTVELINEVSHGKQRESVFYEALPQ